MVHIIGGANRSELSKDQLLSDMKIQDAAVIGESIRYLRREKATVRIGVYCGRFPTLTARECVFLGLCRTKCDMLVVLVESDYSARLKKEGSLCKQSTKERMFAVASLPFVDWVASYDEDVPDLALSIISPDVVYHGMVEGDGGVVFQQKILEEIAIPLDKSVEKKAIVSKFFDIG